MNPLGRWRPRTFRTQVVVSTMLLTALGMLLVGLGLQVLVYRIVEGNVTTVLDDRADAVVGAVDAGTTGATLVVPPGVLDPGVVVFDGDSRRVAGMASPRLADHVEALAGSTRFTFVTVENKERLLARPFSTTSGARGVVVVAEPLEPYEQAELYVGLGTLIVGLIAVLTVGLIAQLVSTRALAPVARMAERATEWSERDLEHRFELGPPVNEHAALGATLDGLLERVARTILAEQRLTAELAHELRTPLAAILGAADLALMRGGLDEDARIDLEQIAQSSRAMAETITVLLELSRDPGAREKSTTCLLGDVISGVATLVPDRLVLDDTTVPSHDVRLASPRDLAVRALAPLVDNAARHASTRVTLSAEVAGRMVLLRVADDGAGIDSSVRDALFTPGASGPGGGTGLGLGIALRAAHSVGGDVAAEDPVDGAIFTLRLPRA